MLKIRKGFTIKVISLLVAGLFLFDSAVYAIDLSNKTHLRPRLLSQDQRVVDPEGPITGNIANDLTRMEIATLLIDVEENSDDVKKVNSDLFEVVKERCDRVRERYGKAIEKELKDRGILPDDIKEAMGALEDPENAFLWFEARVWGKEKYFLGHKSALAVNIIRYLLKRETDGNVKNLLDEYILHEAVEKALEHSGISHHEAIRITNKIFDREPYDEPRETHLGKALRAFIDAQADAQAIAERKKKPPVAKIRHTLASVRDSVRTYFADHKQIPRQNMVEDVPPPRQIFIRSGDPYPFYFRLRLLGKLKVILGLIDRFRPQKAKAYKPPGRSDYELSDWRTSKFHPREPDLGEKALGLEEVVTDSTALLEGTLSGLMRDVRLGKDKAIIGLGEGHEVTPHNLGHMTVEVLVQYFQSAGYPEVELKEYPDLHCRIAVVQLGGGKLYLIQNDSDINFSGRPLREALHQFGDPEYVVVADDIFKPLGGMRLKAETAGHGGVKSLREDLGEEVPILFIGANIGKLSKLPIGQKVIQKYPRSVKDPLVATLSMAAVEVLWSVSGQKTSTLKPKAEKLREMLARSLKSLIIQPSDRHGDRRKILGSGIVFRNKLEEIFEGQTEDILPKLELFEDVADDRFAFKERFEDEETFLSHLDRLVAETLITERERNALLTLWKESFSKTHLRNFEMASIFWQETGTLEEMFEATLGFLELHGIRRSELRITVLHRNERSAFEGNPNFTYSDTYQAWLKVGILPEQIEVISPDTHVWQDNIWEPGGEDIVDLVGTGERGKSKGENTEIFSGDTELINIVLPSLAILEEETVGEAERQERKTEFLEIMQPSVNMGLDRIAMVAQGKESIFEIESVEPLCTAIRESVPAETAATLPEAELVQLIEMAADYLRALVWLVGDGAVLVGGDPSKRIQQGSLLLTMSKELLATMRTLRIDRKTQFRGLLEVAIAPYADVYPEWADPRNFERVEQLLDQRAERLSKAVGRALVGKGDRPGILRRLQDDPDLTLSEEGYQEIEQFGIPRNDIKAAVEIIRACIKEAEKKEAAREDAIVIIYQEDFRTLCNLLGVSYEEFKKQGGKFWFRLRQTRDLAKATVSIQREDGLTPEIARRLLSDSKKLSDTIEFQDGDKGRFQTQPKDKKALREVSERNASLFVALMGQDIIRNPAGFVESWKKFGQPAINILIQNEEEREDINKLKTIGFIPYRSEIILVENLSNKLETEGKQAILLGFTNSMPEGRYLPAGTQRLQFAELQPGEVLNWQRPFMLLLYRLGVIVEYDLISQEKPFNEPYLGELFAGEVFDITDIPVGVRFEVSDDIHRVYQSFRDRVGGV